MKIIEWNLDKRVHGPDLEFKVNMEQLIHNSSAERRFHLLLQLVEELGSRRWEVPLENLQT